MARPQVVSTPSPFSRSHDSETSLFRSYTDTLWVDTSTTAVRQGLTSAGATGRCRVVFFSLSSRTVPSCVCKLAVVPRVHGACVSCAGSYDAITTTLDCW